jgi:hypothetical protein
MTRPLLVLAVCASAGALAACEQVKSSNPLSPDVAGPIAGVTISAPQLKAPAQGAQIALGQPVSVVVQNATTTGVRPLSYVFDLAADAAFQAILFTRMGIVPGGNGQTSLDVQVTLSPGTYFWRVHAQDGANTGASATSSFTVFVPVVIQPPGLVSPANGSGVTSAPTLVVADSARSGPAGPISYIFQVATDASFTNVVATGQAAETSGQTSYTVSATLAASTTYYWRAQATDSSHASPYSVTSSFAMPAAAPPPTSGGPMQINGVWFDHAWTGIVENKLRDLLVTGLGGADALNGQAVVDQLNAMGGIYAGAVFQPQHGPGGPPVYGFHWFYVAFVPLSNGALGYQIVEFGTPPPGD